jgi:hypothetical protein
VRCFTHIDTGMRRIEDRSGSEFPDLRAAEHAAVEKARDFLLKQRSSVIFPEFFVEISTESRDLLAMLSLRRLLFVLAHYRPPPRPVRCHSVSPAAGEW